MKKVLQILIVLSLFTWVSSAHATWTMIQNPTSASCNSPCAVTTAATAAHNLLIYLVSGPAGISISSVTAGACNIAWQHVPSSNISVASFAALDQYYCPDSIASITSISATLAGTCSATCVGFVLEGHSTLGTISLDSGATPAGTVNHTTNCTACSGAVLSLSANNKFLGIISADGQTATGVTGTGFTSDSVVNGNGQGHGILSTSGSVTAPATWTQSPTGLLIGSASAFQETSGGVVATPTSKQAKLGKML